MLVLSRKLNQDVIIGDNVKITVLKIKGNTVRLGIEAPRDVRVVRGELPRHEEEPQTQNAEVTIVFSDTKDKPLGDDCISVVPFDKKARSRDRIQGPSSHRVSTQREPLPPTLNTNRLQEILAEISGQ